MRLLFTLIVALACLLPTHEAATATRLKSLRRAQRIYQESNYCHQEVIGSSASVEQLNSEIDAYATAFATHFGLTGDYHQYINFATVPDRTSFDACAGPYSTVVDVFFKFPASSSDFAQYEAYLQANPLSGLASAQCASVSVVANLPGCSAPSTPTGANPTQPPEVTEAPTTAAPATEAPTEAPTSTPTGANPTQAPDTDTNWCHQQVLGSSSTLEQVNSQLDAYATAFATHFGLTGDYHQYVGWARVPDRTSFDACAGPYSTVVDVFFKFSAPTSSFAQYEAYLQANPLSGLASVQCASISVVANLPGCSAMGNPTSTPTGANPTQPPEVTEAPTTEAPTEAPTSTPTGANPTQAPDTDTNWCHQQVLGSSASLEQLNSELDVYATAFASHFGLTGDYHQYVGWARVPDRTSFDACAGPYSTVVDVFFKFPASTSSFAQYEAYLQSNPLSGLSSVQCASISVVANLPGCSAMGNPTSTPTGTNPTQPPEVTEAPTTEAPTTEAPTSTPTGANPTQAPDTDTNWCHQQVLGSSSTLEQVNSQLDAYATAFATHFGLTGDYHQYVGWARVPDRTSFDACAGPYSTVVDVFFKFSAPTSSFAQYEAYLQSNPLSGLSSVQCASISVVANLPGCSAMGNPSTPTGANPTQPPEVTEAPTTAAPATQAPATEAPTEAPSTPTGANPTQAPGPSGTCPAIDFTYDLSGGVISFTPASGASALNFVDVHVHYAGGQLNYRLSVSPSASPAAPAYEVTLPQGLTGITNYWFTYQTSDNVACDTDSYPVTGGAATTQPTPEAPTEAPTTAPAVTQAPPSSSPANVVCYQEIVGSSSSSYAVVSAALTAWEQKMYQALGLTGPIDQSVGHAQVPDRNSFENGCNGPYQTVADLFVYIQATDATYQQISQQLEAFIAANPIVGSHPSISCGARSVTTFLPRCGAVNGGGNPTTAPNPTQPPEVTEAPTAAPTLAATEAPTQAPATEAPTQAPATEAPTEAPTPSTPTGANPTQPPADECPAYEDGTYVCKNGVCTKVSVTVIGTTSCYTTEATCPAPST